MNVPCDYAVNLDGIRCCPCCGDTREAGVCDYCDLHQHDLVAYRCDCTACATCSEHSQDNTYDDLHDLPF